MYEYQATVVQIIDGDTFIASVDMGFYTYSHQHFRLLGYEAPETDGPEKLIGVLAKAKLEELMPVGTIVLVRVEKADSFGRWLAEVQWQGETLSEYLIKLGYGLYRGRNDERPTFDLTKPYPFTPNQKAS